MKRITLQNPMRAAATCAALGLALITIFVCSRSAHAWLKAGTRPAATIPIPVKASAKPEAAIVSPPRTPSQPAKERIGAEVISISRFGLETREIVRPPGKFFLIIENRSGVNPITLRLQSERGERIIEVRQPEDQLDWADELNLHPGRYTLTIAERPAWVCDITITRP